MECGSRGVVLEMLSFILFIVNICDLDLVLRALKKIVKLGSDGTHPLIPALGRQIS